MPKYNQPRKTWQYSNEFKVKAVQLSLIQGVQVQEVANTLDILTKWVKGKYPQKRSRRLKAYV